MSQAGQDPAYLDERARVYRADVERHERDEREAYGHLPTDHPLRARARRRAQVAAAVADEFERRARALREDGYAMTDELVEIAARALFEHDCMTGEPPWVQLAEHERESYRAAQRGPVAAVEARVRAEVAEEQRKIAAATRRLTTALLANESLLQTPFTDQPELTPWTRSVKPALEALRAAVAAGSSRDTTPEGS